MFTLELIVKYLIKFRNQVSQKLISRNGLIVVGATVMTLLLVIFAISLNLIRQMYRQDDLATLGILQSTRALDNINIEILHLVILLNSHEDYNSHDLKNQLDVLESRFTVLIKIGRAHV
mgnify:CR=1 FL=1